MEKRASPKRYDDDDGRTIVDMSAVGEPAYRRLFDRPDHARACEPEPPPRPRELLTRRETLLVMLAGMKWAFLYSMGFVLLLVLFVLFCVKVWFA